LIDLHSHTLHSDGQRSPRELLAEAAGRGLTVLALTDHDTVSGIADATEAAGERGIRLVPGIELSCELHGREVHVLGHFLDPLSQGLVRLAEQMLKERWQRMERMVERARGAGLGGVTLERVIAASGGENLGRPHLARVLVERGYCRSVKDAFDRYLGNGGALFVDRLRLSVEQAVELIRAAGGTSSLAHPGANGVSRQELKTCAGLGLDAVEAYHPEHVPNQAEAYQRWAEELGLLVTAGSDYHGPAVQPDRKLGDRTLSSERFAALEERARRA